MRFFLVLWAGMVAVACAGAPHTSRASSPLTSVDTAWYVVPGNTRSQWEVNLPRAARAAGIESGVPSVTVGELLWSYGPTRTTPIGCQIDGSVLQLRLGHVMPKLAPDAAPSSADRASWDAFVASLWESAHVREAIGARLADSLRVELRHSRSPDCAQLILLTRDKVSHFGSRFSAQIAAELTGPPATIR